jgi:hypothetical protein
MTAAESTIQSTVIAPHSSFQKRTTAPICLKPNPKNLLRHLCLRWLRLSRRNVAKVWNGHLQIYKNGTTRKFLSAPSVLVRFFHIARVGTDHGVACDV